MITQHLILKKTVIYLPITCAISFIVI